MALNGTVLFWLDKFSNSVSLETLYRMKRLCFIFLHVESPPCRLYYDCRVAVYFPSSFEQPYFYG